MMVRKVYKILAKEDENFGWNARPVNQTVLFANLYRGIETILSIDSWYSVCYLECLL